MAIFRFVTGRRDGINFSVRACCSFQLCSWCAWEALLTKTPIFKSGFACIHPGSAADFLSKRWPEENFAALARLMEGQNKAVVWLGASDYREVNRRLSRQV